jgi:hypothetical protein
VLTRSMKVLICKMREGELMSSFMSPLMCGSHTAMTDGQCAPSFWLNGSKVVGVEVLKRHTGNTKLRKDCYGPSGELPLRRILIEACQQAT